MVVGGGGVQEGVAVGVVRGGEVGVGGQVGEDGGGGVGDEVEESVDGGGGGLGRHVCGGGSDEEGVEAAL